MILNPCSVFLPQLRYISYKINLWRTAAGVFLRLVPLGAIAVDATARQSRNRTTGKVAEYEDISSGDIADRPWTAIAGALAGFLLGPEHGSRSHMRTGSSGSHSTVSTSKVTVPGTNQYIEALPLVPVVDVARKNSQGKVEEARESLDARVSKAEEKVPNPEQAKEDIQLELRVLDSLTDDILTACGTASFDAVDKLLSIVEMGMMRSQNLNIQQSTTYSNFGHVCIRKMYALCCRGTQSMAEERYISTDDVRQHVARRALPKFLKQCNTIIRQFAEEAQIAPQQGCDVDRGNVERLICVLEVLATMTLAPQVVDAILPDGDPITQFVHLMRKRPDIMLRQKERTHLFFVYGSLCALISCREGRIRDMVRDILGMAGAELGISL